MIDIQGLFDRGVITTMTVGVSALPYKGFFCFVRVVEPDTRIQGYGLTADEAVNDTIARLQRVHQTRPVTVTHQMPEAPTLRMPGW